MPESTNSLRVLGVLRRLGDNLSCDKTLRVCFAFLQDDFLSRVLRTNGSRKDAKYRLSVR